MIIIIRGHIRNSFETPELYNYIKNLYEINKDIKIFIHTWNCFSNNISWREIEPNNNKVNETIILDYFRDLSHLIKHIIIDDDKNIKLIGNLEGKINGGLSPILGWKNYWYGKYKIIRYIEYINEFEPMDDYIILNIRFDLFTYRRDMFNINACVEFVKNTKTISDKNIFMYNYEGIGVDNIYIGNINTVNKLARKFYYEMDDIFKVHNNTIHQEYIVYRINLTLQ